jgi:hypothetical protein
MSIETSGIAVLRAAVTARRLLLAEAAKVLGVAIERLRVDDGTVLGNGAGIDYWQLAEAVDFSTPVDGEVTWADCAMPGMLIGSEVPRIDLLAKLTGAAFIHDIELPGMLHARVVKPPSFTARLDAVDEVGFQSGFPDARLFVDGSFVAVVADGEYDAVRAAGGLAALATWQDDGGLPVVDGWGTFLRRQDTIDLSEERGEAPVVKAAQRELFQAADRPCLARPVLRPCAVAGRQADGVEFLAGRVQPAQCHRSGACHAGRGCHRNPQPERRLLWPQRRGRCGDGSRTAGARLRAPTGAGPVDARG